MALKSDFTSAAITGEGKLHRIKCIFYLASLHRSTGTIREAFYFILAQI